MYKPLNCRIDRNKIQNLEEQKPTGLKLCSKNTKISNELGSAWGEINLLAVFCPPFRFKRKNGCDVIFLWPRSQNGNEVPQLRGPFQSVVKGSLPSLLSKLKQWKKTNNIILVQLRSTKTTITVLVSSRKCKSVCGKLVILCVCVFVNVVWRWYFSLMFAGFVSVVGIFLRGVGICRVYRLSHQTKSTYQELVSAPTNGSSPK